MSTLQNIDETDLITDSRADINGNFSALNSEKIETSVLDTDSTLAANSDTRICSQKATKAYVDSGGNVNATETTKGIVEIATQAEVNAGTAIGGTGASVAVTPATLVSYATSEIVSVTTTESETLQHSNDTAVVDSANSGFVNTHITRIDRELPNCRVKFSIVSASGSTTDYELYNSGVLVSSGGPSSSGTAWSVDLTDLEVNDTLELWTKRSGSGSTIVTTSNFRLYFDDEIDAIAGKTLLTYLPYDGSGLQTATNTLP